MRALKQRGVPVAGADRMVLTEQIAVQDLWRSAASLLLPEDDLTLAAVLKSPAVGLTRTSCSISRMAAAAARCGAALRGARPSERDGVRARRWRCSPSCSARADFVPPFEFYAELLGARGGRRALLARLGAGGRRPDRRVPDAGARLRARAPAVAAGLPALAAARRRRDQARPGPGRARRGAGHDRARRQGAAGADRVPAGHAAAAAAGAAACCGADGWARSTLPLWSPRDAPATTPMAAAARASAARAEMREYRRLLYVALTRAEDRLYVCGWRERQAAPSAAELVRAGRRRLGAGRAAVAFDASPRSAPRTCWAGAAARACQAAEAPAARGRAPRRHRASAPAPLPAGPPRRRRPSRRRRGRWRRRARRGEAPPVRSPLGEDDGAPLPARPLIHRLLQLLPELRPRRGAAAARRRSSRGPCTSSTADSQAEIVREVLACSSDPRASRRCSARQPGRGCRSPGELGGRTGRSSRPDRPAGGDAERCWSWTTRPTGRRRRASEDGAASICGRWRPTARCCARIYPGQARGLRAALDRRAAADAAAAGAARPPCA